MPAIVEVVAPSRLHFGMFSFSQPDVRQFGGVGAMIGHDTLRLRITSARKFEAEGPLSARVRDVAQRAARSGDDPALPTCRIEVLTVPPEHIGLGTGTQLALAVTAGLAALRGEPPLDPLDLARRSGRAARSAIGTYGFARGGLLVESGKLPDEEIAPLESRVELPPAWRFVILYRPNDRGLSGHAEQIAFRDLTPVPRATTDLLRDELTRELLPAAQAGQLDRFGESVYRFGYAAGMCFAAKQSGAFASPRVARWVRTIRDLGVSGVGQSSWGPAVFAILESEASARDFVERIPKHLGEEPITLVAAPNASGAQIDVSEG